MSGSNNDMTKLIATAVGAAVAGAALGVAVMKLSEKEQIPKQTMSSRPSVIMSDADLLSSDRGEKLMPHQHEEKMRRRIQARALVEEDNYQPRDSVTVRVPATSANMGPGCTLRV